MNTKIGDLVYEVDERHPPPGAIVFSVSETRGILPQVELFQRPIATDDRSRYRRISFGDVVYNPYLLWNRAVGVCFDSHGGCVSPAYPVLRPYESGTERFLHYFFRSKGFTAAVDAIAAGSVTRRRTASLGDILNLTFDLPDCTNRRAANCILGALDDKIELNRKMNQTLEGIARAIFKSWFVDFDPVRAKAEGRDPGLPAEIADLFPSTFVDSELGEIPEGWEVATVSAICSISKDVVQPGDSPEKTWEHYSIPSFDSGRWPALDNGASIKSAKLRVHVNCILVSKLNPQFPRVWYPVVHDTEAAICSTEFIPFVPKPPDVRSCVYELMRSELIQQTIADQATGTTGSRQRAKAEDVARIHWKKPPDGLVHHFCQLVHPMHERVGKALEESYTLAALRDTLLPKLISGELRVPDAERIVGRCE